MGAHEAHPSLRLKMIVCTRTVFARPVRRSSSGFKATVKLALPWLNEILHCLVGAASAATGHSRQRRVAAEPAPTKTRDEWSMCCADGGDRSVLKAQQHVHVRVVVRSLQRRERCIRAEHALSDPPLSPSDAAVAPSQFKRWHPASQTAARANAGASATHADACSQSIHCEQVRVLAQAQRKSGPKAALVSAGQVPPTTADASDPASRTAWPGAPGRCCPGCRPSRTAAPCAC